MADNEKLRDTVLTIRASLHRIAERKNAFGEPMDDEYVTTMALGCVSLIDEALDPKPQGGGAVDAFTDADAMRVALTAALKEHDDDR